MYCDCVLPLPLDGSLTYSVPAGLFPQVGQRVLVPLGRSKHYTALVVRVHDQKPDCQTKDILEVMDETPIVLPVQMKLWQWVSDYYLCSLGEVFKAAIPAGLKSAKKKNSRTPRAEELDFEVRPIHPLTEHQMRAYDQIKESWQQARRDLKR